MTPRNTLIDRDNIEYRDGEIIVKDRLLYDKRKEISRVLLQQLFVGKWWRQRFQRFPHISLENRCTYGISWYLWALLIRR